MIEQSAWWRLGRILFAVAWIGVAGCAATTPAPPPSSEQPAAPPSSGGIELPVGKYTRGDAAAPVTIIEFADYECPFCAQEEPILERLLRDYGSRVRHSYHDYPVHPNATKLAEAARCAGEQGGFWAMHDYLFKHAATLDVGMLGQYGSSLGLDGEALDACVSSGRYREAIEDDAALAKAAGVRGTPTFFVNGKRLDGGQTYNDLSKAVEAALGSEAAPQRIRTRQNTEPCFAG